MTKYIIYLLSIFNSYRLISVVLLQMSNYNSNLDGYYKNYPDESTNSYGALSQVRTY